MSDFVLLFFGCIWLTVSIMVIADPDARRARRAWRVVLVLLACGAAFQVGVSLLRIWGAA